MPMNTINNSILPVLPIRDSIVFPHTENALVFGRQKSVQALLAGVERDSKVVLLLQRNPHQEDPGMSDMYEIGVLVSIEKQVVGEKGEINVLAKGIEKVRIQEVVKEQPYFEARVETVRDIVVMDDEIEAIIRHIANQIKKAISMGKAVDFVFLMSILNLSSALDFSYQVGMIIDMPIEQRQALLEEVDMKKRLLIEVELVQRELSILEIEHKLSAKTQKKFERDMKDSFLREKMRTIEKELGDDGDNRDVDEYKTKIKKARMPKSVEEKAMKELKRLAQMSQYNPESSYVRTYLDWLVELPWNNQSSEHIDVKHAEEQMEKDHFGLKKVKERILEFLAVMELRKRRLEVEQVEAKKDSKKKGKKEGEKPEKKTSTPPTILCFVGPPGVGKTSLGRSIADALGRKFVKMSLGGIRDEAEIRGHRRTYVGALPGRIIQGIKEGGARNPVFMLDEIDKVGKDYRGDPSSALLEALDPEQNHSFSDHYLEVDFDLSEVFFITTANILDTIPDALLDRLEVIHFPGYTEDEKFNITRNYLIKKQLENHSETSDQVEITDDALKVIIRRYTREAGVRNLERQISAIMRKIAREIVEDSITHRTVDSDNVTKYLGPYKYSAQMLEEKDSVGISTGLAWTQAGGDILFIEVSTMPGKGNLTLTGQLGDVMKESCQAALTYIRARWNAFGLDCNFFNEIDIHVHVPEGAVPKDGPSAGIAITSAMISALTNIPVRKDVAMTGEITLRGRIMEIGGIKEKVIAAHRARVKTVIMPQENKKDLEDIPQYVLDDLKFVHVNHMDEVIPNVLAFPAGQKVFLKTKKEQKGKTKTKTKKKE